jgi:hypothetical protein
MWGTEVGRGQHDVALLLCCRILRRRLRRLSQGMKDEKC